MSEIGDELLSTLDFRIERVEPTRFYVLGLVLAAGVMVLLPILYVGLIGLVLWLTWQHARTDTWLLANDLWGVVLYVALVAAGGIAAFFLVKPLVARRRRLAPPLSVSRDDEPLLHAFVDRLCAAVGAPKPVRIDVACDVNAYAGFVSLGRRDLVLTIGLPLAASLTLGELTGVLAHELGHFGQSGAMRISTLIRTIDAWFARVVYERDAWDHAVDELATRSRNGWILAFGALIKACVVVSRGVLWSLMWLGHVVSAYSMRHQEFASDLCQARVVGTDGFVAAHRKIRLLAAAQRATGSSLVRFWSERRLPDDLPAMVVAVAERTPEETRATVEEAAARTRTRFTDTHPCDRDREVHVEQSGATGFVHDDRPAAWLVSDLRTLCQHATFVHYRQRLGRRVEPRHLRPNTEFFAREEATHEDLRALERYFGVTPDVLRSLPFAAAATASGPVRKTIREDLRRIRVRVESLATTYPTLVARYAEVTQEWGDARRACAMRQAEVKFDAAASAFVGSDEAALIAARDAAAGQRAALSARLEVFECAAAERLSLALRLLDVDDVASTIEASSAWREEIARIAPALALLHATRADRAELWWLAHELRAIAANPSASAASTRRRDALHWYAAHVHDALRSIRERLREALYPFDHSDPNATIGEFALPLVYSRPDVGWLLNATARFVQAIAEIEYRALARLARIAEALEAAAGLSTLDAAAGSNAAREDVDPDPGAADELEEGVSVLSEAPPAIRRRSEDDLARALVAGDLRKAWTTVQLGRLAFVGVIVLLLAVGLGRFFDRGSDGGDPLAASILGAVAVVGAVAAWRLPRRPFGWTIAFASLSVAAMAFAIVRDRIGIAPFATLVLSGAPFVLAPSLRRVERLARDNADGWHALVARQSPDRRTPRESLATQQKAKRGSRRPRSRVAVVIGAVAVGATAIVVVALNRRSHATHATIAPLAPVVERFATAWNATRIEEVEAFFSAERRARADRGFRAALHKRGWESALPKISAPNITSDDAHRVVLAFPMESWDSDTRGAVTTLWQFESNAWTLETIHLP
ncbi:MAG: M48 family metalloprotease [Planctomycetes bacterium]|nr:M48 family metalloprotease [Planctomycetota bacterium]